MKRTLYYFHDPMCSWCYGFKPTLNQLLVQLPNGINTQSVLGGLAADSMQPMPNEMQLRLQSNWHAIIKKMPNTVFNFDFWQHCQPIRSTYPACRAVLVAKKHNDALADKMTEAIQTAYYQQAKNPALIDTLVDIATTINLDAKAFKQSLLSDEIEQQLQQQLQLCQDMNIYSFPSLVLTVDNKTWPIAIDYNHVKSMLEEIIDLNHETIY